MTNNSGKNKRSKKPLKKKTKNSVKKFPRETKVKCFPQLMKVIEDYFKHLKKKKAQ